MSSVSKNTAYMTMASVGQKVISFGYFTLIARYLAPELVGKYTTALAFTTLFAILVDLGLGNVFIREGAKQQDELQSLLSRVLGIKVWLALMTYLIIAGAASAADYDTETTLLIFISGITVLFDSLQVTLYGALRAMGQLKYEAVGIIGTQLLTAILGGVFLASGLPVMFLMLAFLISSTAHVFYAATVLIVRFRLYPRPRLMRRLDPLLRTALPFALAGIFFRIYSSVDSLMVFSVLGATAAGWYAIPIKITTAFQFIPLALVAATYPRFSEWSVHDPKRLYQVFGQSLQYLLIIALPIAVGIIVMAPIIVPLFFTAKYIASIEPLRLLMVSMIFSFLMFPVGACLNAIGKQGMHTTFVGIATAINVVLNWLLIPRVGIVGAAAATLATSVFLFGAEYLYVSRTLPVSHGSILWTSSKIVLAAAGMAVGVLLVRDAAPWWASVLLGGFLYGILLLVTRAVTWQQITKAWTMTRS